MRRNWFITGTSTGFGRLMTEQLLARGDAVTATVRHADAIDELASRHPDRLSVATLDVTDATAVVDVVDRAFATMGRIDVVVSNAGYGLFGAAEELTQAQIRAQIETNLLGSIAVIRASLPHLRGQGGGRIVQVSSEGGQVAYPSFSAYHASKWGIEGFVEAVALEVAPFGIDFTIVEPGPTRTHFRGGLVVAPAMPAYGDTPSGAMRRAIETDGFPRTGDPAKMAAAIIASTDVVPAPRRLALGSGSYDRIGTALSDRLAELEAHAAVTRSCDATG